MNILHLSDIHFGIEKHKKGLFDNKQTILDDLITLFQEMEVTKKPQHVIVTGDVAWFGQKTEFDEARNWFEKLLNVLNLTGDDISFCVGNHDVDRNSSVGFDEKMFLDTDLMESYYSYDNMYRFEKQIHNYNDFCYELGVWPYIYPIQNARKFSYSIGYKLLPDSNIRLVAFNSSVLSQSSEVLDSEMLLGRAQILDLEERGIIGNVKEDDTTPYVIAIFHHDPKFLKSTEQNEYNGKIASLNRLMENVDLALCGHTETGGLPQRKLYANGGMLVTSGAAYYEDNHNNAFSIIHIDKDKAPDFTFYRWVDGKWQQYSGDKELKIEKKKTTRLTNMQINRDFVKDGSIIKNGKFVVSLHGKSAYIDLRKMIMEIDNGKVKISNNNDVARNLEVTCTYENGKTDFSIAIPVERYGCVSATLEREEFFWFIKSHCAQDTLTKYALIDEAGNELIYGSEKIKWSGIEDTDSKSVEMLKRISNIEDAFNVKFYLPEDFYDFDEGRLNVIEDIIYKGYTDRYSIHTGMSAGIDNKRDLKRIRDFANRDNRFQWYYSGEYDLKLWGCKIKIGKVHFLSSVYKVVDKRVLKQKIKTFQLGDIRAVNFIPEKEEKWYIIFDDYYKGEGDEFKKAPLLPCPVKRIPFDMFSETKKKD